MTFVFVLYKYFPHGGLQRDFFRITEEAMKRGHQVSIYTTAWEGERPGHWDVRFLKSRGWSNHQRMRHFATDVHAALKTERFDALVGFNKMPGLDVYYAADSCYVERIEQSKNAIYRCSSRYRTYAELEKAVFDRSHAGKILLIAEPELERFQRHYQTARDRFVLLPPGVSRDRVAGDDAPDKRIAVRRGLSLGTDELMLLQVGSAFKTKGLDRSLEALASLPESLRLKTRFMVAGRGHEEPFRKLAKTLGVLPQVTFLGPRDDVPDLLLAADLLIHPAYTENTGTVLLEAMAAGLPVLATGNCGYAGYVKDSESGHVVEMPFAQKVLNETLQAMLASGDLSKWGRNGHAYVQAHDIFSMPQKAVDAIETVAGRRS